MLPTTGRRRIPGSIIAMAAALAADLIFDLESRGLRVIADLGQWWAEHGAGPLPLGLNVIKRDKPIDTVGT